MNTNREQEIIDLSRQKWNWMSAQDVDALAALFHDESVFVHMSRTMSREEELNVIRTGNIHYKHVDIQDVSVRFVSDTTAILLNKIRLDAVVRENEVSNPFEVTEVYVRHGDTWKLASLSFTRLVIPGETP